MLLFTLTMTSACSTLAYHAQSVQGQLEIFNKSQPIQQLLEDPKLADDLRTQLETVLALRQFAIQQLDLPDNNSYLEYADMGRDHIVWTIFATEEFSLTARQWCFLIVGCLNYRGYFAEQKAKEFANSLSETGFDVYLGGVAAYSTLGWFDDPILNTMLRWNDIRLASVIFHELAHQQLYINNDSEFNEAYAEVVALIGVRKWLSQNNDQTLLSEFEAAQTRGEQFIDLVMRYKSLLGALYLRDMDETKKREHKAALMQQMARDYESIQIKWGDKNDYQKWFADGMNNAKLAAISTYRELVPPMLTIYEKLAQNLDEFYHYMSALSKCDANERKKIIIETRLVYDC